LTVKLKNIFDRLNTLKVNLSWETIFFLMFLTNYFSILIFFVVSVILASIIFFLSFFLSSKLDDAEKLSAYECGFNPFSDSRSEFDIKFYIVAILFLIFDLEISFLFPFSVCLDVIQLTGLYVMLVFLFILTIGFYYE
jgi:NADH-quinone oxidoreductase subunit A